MTANTWPTVPMGQVMTHRKQFVEISDLNTYKRCRVQLHAQGIILRDIVPGAQIKTKAQQVCRSGEFLVAEIDAKVGGIGVVPESLDGAIVSGHYFLFTLNETALDQRFLDLYIQTPAFGDQVAARGSTNYAAIRPHHVLQYTIPLPPLDEQRRIVARIQALAAKIEEARGLRRQAAQEAEALVRSALDHAIQAVDIPAIPLEDACAAIVDNLHTNPNYSWDGVPCVRSPDVGWGSLHLAGALKTSEEEFLRRTVRGRPMPGDVVLVREGGGTGKAALVREGERFSLGQRVMMLRPDVTKVLPKFFLYQLISPLVYDDQIVPLSKGSASPHLNIGALRKFCFRLPALAEQRRIVAYLDGLQAKVDALKRLQAETAAELDALLPSVLDRAFKGEL